MPVRDRANIVCTECHSRKIKCDLQTTPEGEACKNCRRSQQVCIPRHGVRKRRAGLRPRKGEPRIESSPDLSDPSLDAEMIPESENGGGLPQPPQQSNGFLSTCTKIYYGEHQEMVSAESSHKYSSNLRDVLLQSMQLDVLPRPAVLRAWTDAYMAHVYHHCPVADQTDLSSPRDSVLQKVIGMIGHLTRHGPRGPKLAQEMYDMSKTLVYMNHEPGRVQNLKAMCLLSVYSATPSNAVSLDGPWHWIGLAMRQLMQMGLNRDTAYANRPDARCLRRIFWYLHNSDCFQVAAWGRPPLLRTQDFDVSPPMPHDFEVPNVQSLAFVASTQLCQVLRAVFELHQKRQPARPDEVARIEGLLCDWVRELPDDLRIYDRSGGRKPYCRAVSEFMIQYFTTIIFSEILGHKGREQPWQVSVPSLIAASCAVALLDDIYCRDEAIFLPWTIGCSCLVIALPLIHHVPPSPAKEAARKIELTVLRSVMMEMRDRYGDARMVLRMMKGLEKSTKRTATGENPSPPTTQVPFSRAPELFPFPPTLCENMDLVALASAPVDEYAAFSFAPVQNWPADDAVFDFALVDLFGGDDMGFGLVGEQEGFAMD